MRNEHEPRFWSKVTKGDGCWIWTGTLTTSGYGQFKADRKTLIASRVAYEFTNGPIAAGHSICHRCDEPRCVNPAHLFSATHSENMADMVRKGRATGNRKLSSAQVAEVRTLRACGWKHRELGAKFNVSISTITHLLTGRTWAREEPNKTSARAAA